MSSFCPANWETQTIYIKSFSSVGLYSGACGEERQSGVGDNGLWLYTFNFHPDQATFQLTELDVSQNFSISSGQT